jgi:mono/diheme cytochrome c family protein
MEMKRVFSLAAVVALVSACAAGTSTGGSAASPRARGAADIPPDTSAAVIAEGRTLFTNGQIARCSACHGATGQGANNGPNLRDNDWLQIDGGFSSIAYIIRNGVSRGDVRMPEAHQFPMPARGVNEQLTDEQVNKIATYVWSLRNEKQ